MEWKRFGEKWLTIQLKDEEAMATLEKELETFRELGKKQVVEAMEQARTMTTTITIIAFAVGIVLIGIAIFMLARRGLSLPGH